MSRNGKYYVKKLDKSSSKGCMRIDVLFGAATQKDRLENCVNTIKIIHFLLFDIGYSYQL